MKYLIAAVLMTSIISVPDANALGRREEGVLIGLGSAILVGSVMRDRENRQSGGYGSYGRYGQTDFPDFRCRGNSVECSYQRGVWEREREIWLQEKENAYMCGRYPERCGGRSR